MPEPKIISSYVHSYAHKNPGRYAYVGKEDGEPTWLDWGSAKARTRTSSQVAKIKAFLNQFGHVWRLNQSCFG